MMSKHDQILAAQGGFFSQTYRAAGLRGCLRKMTSALKMQLPLWLLQRRTNASVGAYFDLITDDARMFYDDSFHFGFFHDGASNFQEGIAAHTDMVAKMARLEQAATVLDIGCGIGAPALRIAETFGGTITGINISREQIRQGRALVAERGLSARIDLRYGNALALDFPDHAFDALLCLEVAGDICVSTAQKQTLMQEIDRVLKPGGHVGFSDLVFTSAPPVADEAIMRTILYHEGRELITDWPALFRAQGFQVDACVDMIDQTHATWDYSLGIYEARAEEVERRYGKKIAAHTMAALRRIPAILKTHGAFIVLSATKSL